MTVGQASADALDALYWRAEILQALYWMRGEGLADAVAPASRAVPAHGPRCGRGRTEFPRRVRRDDTPGPRRVRTRLLVP